MGRCGEFMEDPYFYDKFPDWEFLVNALRNEKWNPNNLGNKWSYPAWNTGWYLVFRYTYAAAHLADNLLPENRHMLLHYLWESDREGRASQSSSME